MSNLCLKILRMDKIEKINYLFVFLRQIFVAQNAKASQFKLIFCHEISKINVKSNINFANFKNIKNNWMPNSKNILKFPREKFRIWLQYCSQKSL